MINIFYKYTIKSKQNLQQVFPSLSIWQQWVLRATSRWWDLTIDTAFRCSSRDLDTVVVVVGDSFTDRTPHQCVQLKEGISFSLQSLTISWRCLSVCLLLLSSLSGSAITTSLSIPHCSLTKLDIKFKISTKIIPKPTKINTGSFWNIFSYVLFQAAPLRNCFHVSCAVKYYVQKHRWNDISLINMQKDRKNTVASSVNESIVLEIRWWRTSIRIISPVQGKWKWRTLSSSNASIGRPCH